jgi:hypothetical protein
MANLPVRPASAQKPLEPVQLLRVECQAGIADLIAGHAVLAISVGDPTDSNNTVYWVRADVDYRGKITGFQLQQFGTGVRYELDADLTSCSCPDATYREERPGGCKHRRALREALLGIGKAAVTPDEDIAHADTSGPSG